MGPLSETFRTFWRHHARSASSRLTQFTAPPSQLRAEPGVTVASLGADLLSPALSRAASYFYSRGGTSQNHDRSSCSDVTPSLPPSSATRSSTTCFTPRSAAPARPHPPSLTSPAPAPAPAQHHVDAACPISTGGGTRRVRLVRGVGSHLRPRRIPPQPRSPASPAPLPHMAPRHLPGTPI